MDTSEVDKIITGRVKPHIYAFRTGTIPDYLKIGDTYRPVETRLDEWKEHYKALEEVYRGSAAVSDDVFFRDYAVHQFIEEDLNLHRLQREEITSDIYYSNEFFHNATREHVESAVEDIRSDFSANTGRYHFYRFDESRVREERHYPRCDKEFVPREEQEETVRRFLEAKAKGRTNLLMYAVMRFGKSFTAMLCAKAMDAMLVVVVCGKTAVADEWQRNVEIPKNFEGYSFKTRADLDSNHNLLSEAKASGQRIVLFLTLQDLSGDEVKERHKELFESEIDLVIVDETHFGARAPEYGKVLRDEFGLSYGTAKKEAGDEDDVEDLDAALKLLHSKVKLHLSGTPYRILMGSEFAPDDVIAFYQFTDIVEAQQKWEREHLDDPECKEWDNPYYGFPQMVRFAFNPSDSARKLIKELKAEGRSCALSDLFAPQSVRKDAGKQYQLFKHESEILELLEVIDGSKEDDELLGFLDYDKIKKGQMCRHLVFVLPFKASCDAMCKLLADNRDKFKNLSQYKVLNIAGHDCPKALMKSADIKRRISDCEENGQKTITLTVNKMLTGSTVEQWDAMLFFKDTSSPQEYDQAVFRIQSPYIKTMTSPDEREEDKREIKFNMKPQTLLADFDIDRLFRLQAMKSQAFNANVDARGNAQLEDRIRRELDISPVIVLNKGRLKQASTADIMDAVSEYSKTRSVADEAKDVPVDMRLMNDPIIKAEIDKQPEIDSKQGLALKPIDGEGDDIDTGSGRTESDSRRKEGSDSRRKEKENPEVSFRKRFATYYSRILFFTFLSNDAIRNLDDLISAIGRDEDNLRIAKNLGLRRDILVHLQASMDGAKLGALEFKIMHLNRLVGDTDLPPLERAKTAFRRFSRLSEDEITTPENIAKEMVRLLPGKCSASDRYLDIAAKQGEFAIALVERFGDAVKSNVWSLPTSGTAYEFTRKIYEFLGMPAEHIFDKFSSRDLIGNNRQEYFDILNNMRFDVIVGNPPYQEKEGSNTRRPPIYNHFFDISFRLSPIVTLITPGRFLFHAGHTSSEWMDKMLSNPHFKVVNYFQKSSDAFTDVDIKGGVVITLYDANRDFGSIGIFSSYPELKSIVGKVTGNKHFVFKPFSALVSSQGIYRFAYKAFIDYPEIEDVQGKGTASKIVSKTMESMPRLFRETKSKKGGEIGLVGLSGGQRVCRWIKKEYVQENEYLGRYNVFVPEANGTGAIGEVLSTPMIGEPMIGHTDTFLSIGKFDTEGEAEACLKYVKSKFCRTLLGSLKATQHNPRKTWANVPLQDFGPDSDIDWTERKDSVDTQLYRKYNLSESEIAFIESKIRPM